MFQEFPYTNFHQLNLDWIVKIAKDFLDQYTHIQEVIQTGLDDLAESRETGLEELNQKTLDGLAELQEKYDTLNGLLQAWYDTHSADIAGQLAQAIIDFNTAAEAKSQALLDSWPADYSELVTEYNNLKNGLNLSTDTEVIYFTEGYFIKTNLTTGETVSLTPQGSGSSALGYAVVSCQPGDIFTLTGTGGSTGRLYAFIDSSDKMLDGKASTGESKNNETITAPSSAVKVIFNAETTGRGLFCKKKSIQYKIDELKGKDNSLDADIANLLAIKADKIPVNYAIGATPITFENATYYKIENDQIDITDKQLSATYQSAVIPCQAGDFFTLNVKGSGTTIKGCSFIDSSGNVLDGSRTFSTRANNEMIMAPENTVYAVLNDVLDGSKPSYIGKMYVVSELGDTQEEYCNITDDDVFQIRKYAYSVKQGIVTQSGSEYSSDTYKYARTSAFFYAKAGSVFKCLDGQNPAVAMYVSRYTAADTSTFQERSNAIHDYNVTISGYYKITIAYTDTTLTANDTIFDNLYGNAIQIDVDQEPIVAHVSSLTELVIAARNNYVDIIVIDKDINANGTQITFGGNKLVIGNGHTITGLQTQDYLFYIDSGTVVVQDLILTTTADDVVYVGGDSVVKLIRCDISHSYANDGVGTHGTSVCYIIDCVLHDCYDEGVSTHDGSYCEVIGTEAYNCGYVIGTDTSSGASFGGIHIGASQMGQVKNCYAHNNTSYGIAFIPVDGLTDADIANAKCICIGNSTGNNAAGGLVFSSARNIQCHRNTAVDELRGLYFMKRTGFEHGCSGNIVGNSYVGDTTNVVIHTGGNDGLVFDVQP